jgi:hypothetical protein
MQHRSYLPTYPTTAIPAGLELPTPGLPGLPGRLECRPTRYRSVRHPLELIDEDMVTGLGAATELPEQYWCEA